MCDRKAVIQKTDMSEDMQHDAVECAKQALEKYNSEQDMASYIKGIAGVVTTGAVVSFQELPIVNGKLEALFISPRQSLIRPLTLLMQYRVNESMRRTAGMLGDESIAVATMSDRKAVIKNADMSEDMQQDAVECATQALEKYNIEKDIAAYIKKEFDKKYNPTWHCIVGRNFGSYVTHETKHFIYFYLGQVAILLFKSG
ncbi:hypothetical protein F2P81_014160 [Scophthalmus maximus]|uniref:Dynein light chain n=1 Tax=Scophthalmus maximus TaxID=52904 RepID=A0A6A4SSP8_SCOMX|nr:hypothetical protein F2P81_014160 [Scophthalmus maximus]